MQTTCMWVISVALLGLHNKRANGVTRPTLPHQHALPPNPHDSGQLTPRTGRPRGTVSLVCHCV